MKITTRIFTGATMAALLISINTGAFACDGCMKGQAAASAKTSASTKVIAKGAKPSAKVVAQARIAPKTSGKAAKTAAKNASKPVAVKLTTLQNAKLAPQAAAVVPPCCAHEHADAKK